jgi:predicted TIM-barrel fold metal-dependent hydrolase
VPAWDEEEASMSHTDHPTAAEIRARLQHPVIDGDGHWLEFGPLVRERLRKIGGDRAADGFQFFTAKTERELALSVAERVHQRVAQPPWWAFPTRNTRDRATAMMPRLLDERLEELGIDFAVLYPTTGLALPRLPDADVRRATCRAFNTFVAEFFAEFSDRITPAAVIPMHTPEEAIEELEHVSAELNLKVILMGSLIPRSVPALAARSPEAAQVAPWYDALGLDSLHDYDPVWAKCAQLGLSPTFHTGGRGFGLRLSPSNFVYNHIGHFASAGEAVCKALFLGGVTRRFPAVKFAFLEGGVGWACQLYADLLSHWEKRRRAGLEATDPGNLDRAHLLRLAERYGTGTMAEAIRQGQGFLEGEASEATGALAELDDFSACRINTAEELRDLFTRPFYFGCEADDRMNAWAFNRQVNPLGARLRPLFGSDIAHFDVPSMAAVVPEAYELVEDGLISADDLRDFMFANPVRFWGEANPGFFKGTVVEHAAAALLVPPEGSPGTRSVP